MRVERRVEHVAKLAVGRRDTSRLALRRYAQQRCLDHRRHLSREERQQLHLGLLVSARLARVDRERSDRAVLEQQRHRHAAADSDRRRHLVLPARVVLDDDGRSARERDAHRALTARDVAGATAAVGSRVGKELESVAAAVPPADDGVVAFEKSAHLGRRDEGDL